MSFAIAIAAITAILSVLIIFAVTLATCIDYDWSFIIYGIIALFVALAINNVEISYSFGCGHGSGCESIENIILYLTLSAANIAPVAVLIRLNNKYQKNGKPNK